MGSKSRKQKKNKTTDKMEKYKFRKYDENFSLLYKRELARLKRLLPRHANIEHIGSTAVKGLKGKGLIEIGT